MNRWVIRFVDGSIVEIERPEQLATFCEALTKEMAGGQHLPLATFLGSSHSNWFNSGVPKGVLFVWDKVVSIVET